MHMDAHTHTHTQEKQIYQLTKSRHQYLNKQNLTIYAPHHTHMQKTPTNDNNNKNVEVKGKKVLEHKLHTEK